MRTAKHWGAYIQGRGDAPNDNPLDVHWGDDGVADEDLVRIIATVQREAIEAAAAAVRATPVVDNEIRSFGEALGGHSIDATEQTLEDAARCVERLLADPAHKWKP